MTLQVLSNKDLVSVGGGVDTTVSDPAEQLLLAYLGTLSADDLNNFVQNNVHVNVNVQMVYFPQLDAYAANMQPAVTTVA